MSDDMAPSSEDAARDLLEFLTDDQTQDFALSISCMDGVWQVSLTDYATGIANVGKGDSFAAAWHARDVP
jgi:hypothetical protein